jgi:hypothetical protein
MGFDVFEPRNMIIVLVNIIFFMVVQTLFFEFEASKQFNFVLEDKAKIAQTYLQYDKNTAVKYQQFKTSEDAKNIESVAKKQEKQRKDENTKLIINWLGIPIFVATFLLIVFIVMQNYKSDHKWGKVDAVLLISVILLGYVPEILFFFGVVHKYKFYGDCEIYGNLYNEMDQHINKEPVTEKGKDYKHILDGMIDKLSRTGTNVDNIKKIYSENKKNLARIGITEEFLITYANAHLKNASEYINSDVFNNMQKVTA